MKVWRNSAGEVLRDASGNILLCDDCPCAGTSTTVTDLNCCGGTLPSEFVVTITWLDPPDGEPCFDDVSVLVIWNGSSWQATQTRTTNCCATDTGTHVLQVVATCTGVLNVFSVSLVVSTGASTVTMWSQNVVFSCTGPVYGDGTNVVGSVPDVGLNCLLGKRIEVVFTP